MKNKDKVDEGGAGDRTLHLFLNRRDVFFLSWREHGKVKRISPTADVGLISGVGSHHWCRYGLI